MRTTPLRTACLPFLLAIFAGSAVRAQSLEVKVQINSTLVTVSSGGTVAFEAEALNRERTGTVTLKNTGSLNISVTAITLTGASAFTLQNLPALPAALAPNATATFNIRYLPTSANPVTAQVKIDYTENSTARLFQFSVSGTAPDVALSYFLEPDGASTPVTPGGRIGFPDTPVGNSKTVQFVVFNRGSAPAAFTAASVPASDFSLSSVPSFPLSIPPGRDARFRITFAPSAAGPRLATLSLGLTGETVLITLEGRGTAPSAQLQISYFFPPDGALQTVSGGGTIGFPDTVAGQTKSATMVIANRGSGSGTLNAVAVAGAGYSLSGLPALPATIAAGQEVRFTLTFVPTATGPFLGTLTVTLNGEANLIRLQGNGTSGARLEMSYFLLPDGPRRTISSGGTIGFPDTPLGERARVEFLVTNRGTGAGRINLITLVGGAFQLFNVPALPKTLAPGEEARFLILFEPPAAAPSLGTLTIKLDDADNLIQLEGRGIVGSQIEYTYFTLPDGSPVRVSEGGTISFPDTVVGETRAVALQIANRGRGPAVLSLFVPAGTAFTIEESPLLPATIGPGEHVRYVIRFRPSLAGQAVGVLTLEIDGRTVTLNLQGRGTLGTQFVFGYYVAPDGVLRSVSAGGTIAFPDTVVGKTESIVVIVTNRGPGAGTLSSVVLGGTGLTLENLPALPVRLNTGEDARFKVTFRPIAPGVVVGTLILTIEGEPVRIHLEARGTIADLVLSYTLADGNARSFGDGGRLVFLPTAANTTATAQVRIQNKGSGEATLRSVTLSGERFELAGLPAFPATIAPGSTLGFEVRFSPRSTGTFTGELVISFTERSVRVAVEGSTSAAEFQLSYVDPRTTSRVLLAHGGRLPFPDTPVDTDGLVTLVIANRGPGTGFLDAMTVEGADSNVFELIDLPVLPLAIPANNQFQIALRFRPRERRAHAAMLRVELTGASFRIDLAGLGTGATFVYEILTDETARAVTPGGVIEFPDTEVRRIAELVLRVRNEGNAEGQLGSVTLLGGAFQVTDLPILPATIPVGEAGRLRLRFAPTEPGLITGRLRIGADHFELRGLALGRRLQFTYSDAAATGPVEEGSVITLSSTPVGERARGEFLIENTGTVPVSLASIAVVPVSQVFLLEGLPSFPFSLEPGESLRFRIIFAPNNVGLTTATLLINTSTIGLAGMGLRPVALAPYRFTGAAGTQEPLQQPEVGLALAQAYTLPLEGELTLEFISEYFSPNPAVQFSTGGRTARFRIAAGATEARFDNGATRIRLQTGTVAGRIVLRPRFVTEGGLDLTPNNPPELVLTIPSGAPKLLDLGVFSRTATGFTLAISGYTTTRSLRQLELELTPRPGEKLSATRFTVNLESSALIWFQSETSYAYGGLFTVAIPISLGLDAREDQVRRIQSVSVTVTNELGRSNTLSTEIR